MFNLMDVDGDNSIDKREFAAAVRSDTELRALVGFKNEPTRQGFQQAYTAFDVDGIGSITWDNL